MTITSNRGVQVFDDEARPTSDDQTDIIAGVVRDENEFKRLVYAAGRFDQRTCWGFYVDCMKWVDLYRLAAFRMTL